MTTMSNDQLSALNVDPTMLNASVTAVENCFGMCSMKVKCVGMSTVPTAEPGKVTGLIGVHGQVSGFVTVNMSDEAAIAVVGGLLMDSFEKLDHQVIDGVGEIANIVSGGIKNGLAGSPWAFSHVTVPSVIVGQNYQIAYSKGLNYLSSTFELVDSKAIMTNDRMIQVTISLIRL